MTTWKERARNLKRDVVAIALAVRDPRVPWYAKAVGACVIAYALSPIDLIPDFVPVLGYLDDLVLVPLGLLLVLRLIPADILAEHRVAATAHRGAAGQPRRRRGGDCHLGAGGGVAGHLARHLSSALTRSGRHLGGVGVRSLYLRSFCRILRDHDQDHLRHRSRP